MYLVNAYIKITRLWFIVVSYVALFDNNGFNIQTSIQLLMVGLAYYFALIWLIMYMRYSSNAGWDCYRLSFVVEMPRGIP